MSTPNKSYENPVQGALNEIISAMSALNMPPEPIEEPNKVTCDYRPLFLSETDGMVQHAMEHMSAACEVLYKAYQEREGYQHKIYRLECRIRELESMLPKGSGVDAG